MAEKKSPAGAKAATEDTKSSDHAKSTGNAKPAASAKSAGNPKPAAPANSVGTAKPTSRAQSTKNETAVVATESTGAGASLSPDEDTLWAALAHLGGVVGLLPSLIIFLVFRHRGAKTGVESREALNWQITFTIGWLIIELLVTIVASLIIGAAAGLGGHPGDTLAFVLGLVPVAIWILNIVLSVIGFVKVNGGGTYRYPFAVRLLK